MGGEVQHLDLERQPAAAVEPWKGQIFTVRLDPPLELAVFSLARGLPGAAGRRPGRDWGHGGAGGIRSPGRSATVERLHAMAAELWPPIGSAPVVESWTGLRPGTSDGLPLIGSAGQPHCWVATGHFRNGILLAPATGLIVRQLLEGRPPAAGLELSPPDGEREGGVLSGLLFV